MINWTYQGKEVKSIEDVPDNAIGFIYKIINRSKGGKVYYGRKTIRSKRKKKLTKKEKQLKENKRKRFKYVWTEYKKWPEYTGSNKLLNEDLAGGDQYSKEILQWCYKKAELTYYEGKAILCSDCLLSDDCYNEWNSTRVYAKHLRK